MIRAATSMKTLAAALLSLLLCSLAPRDSHAAQVNGLYYPTTVHIIPVCIDSLKADRKLSRVGAGDCRHAGCWRETSAKRSVCGRGACVQSGSETQTTQCPCHARPRHVAARVGPPGRGSIGVDAGSDDRAFESIGALQSCQGAGVGQQTRLCCGFFVESIGTAERNGVSHHRAVRQCAAGPRCVIAAFRTITPTNDPLV